ncbi:MAG TPA: hypothetical protein VD790_00920 [Thermoleophilaceae bacterium]|nr:hypothetical protein [Thermoleophilaceae bacterium]
MADLRTKVDIGFTGGQVLALRVEKEVFDTLRKAVEGEQRFYDLDAGDSTVTLDLSQVVYLRVETEDHRVGF